MPAPFISNRISGDAKTFKTTLTAQNAIDGKIDISALGNITPLTLSLDSMVLVLDIDYQITQIAGTTYLEFINELAPTGVSAIEAGEVIVFLYAAEPA